jgi:hypothetical protein
VAIASLLLQRGRQLQLVARSEGVVGLIGLFRGCERWSARRLPAPPRFCRLEGWSARADSSAGCGGGGHEAARCRSRGGQSGPVNFRGYGSSNEAAAGHQCGSLIGWRRGSERWSARQLPATASLGVKKAGGRQGRVRVWAWDMDGLEGRSS